MDAEERSAEFKAQGNAAFSKGEDTTAITFYTQSIELTPNNHALYSNRSAAHLRLGNLDDALKDAEQCVSIKPGWSKGYGRKGAVLFALGSFQDALDAYCAGLVIDCSNASLIQGRELCKAKLEPPPAITPPDMMNKQSEPAITIDKSTESAPVDIQPVNKEPTAEKGNEGDDDDWDAFMQDTEAAGEQAKAEETPAETPTDTPAQIQPTKEAEPTPPKLGGAAAEARADELKSEGNSAFAKGNDTKAVELYTQALKLMPSNHVILSNRSAARLRIGFMGDALKDAEECIRLNPMWGKAHGRKGAALFAMKRYDDAMDAYCEGLTIDKTNKTLSQGRDKCRRAIDSSIGTGISSEESSSSSKKEAKVDDAAFDVFMTQINELDPNQVPKELKVTAVDHDAETAGWTPANQLDRLLCPRYEWLNLNPFTAFGLGMNATAEDVKKRYRKLSALVHPDKNLTDKERAQNAFEQVKKAYEVLKKDSERDALVKLIKNITKKIVVTRNRLKSKGLTEDEVEARDGPLARAIDIGIKKEFATREQRRRNAEARLRKYDQREKEEEESKSGFWEGVKDKEVKFREGRETRAKNWQGFAKAGSGSGDGKSKKRGGFKPPPVKAEESSAGREGDLKKFKGQAGVDQSYKAKWR